MAMTEDVKQTENNPAETTEISGEAASDEDPARNDSAGTTDRTSNDGDVTSTDDENDDDGDDDEEGGDTSNSNNNGDDALVKATLLKEEGNSHFKNGKWDEAARCYRRGSNRLKKVSGIDADPQVKPLQLTLQTNLSMVLYKQTKYRASRDMAGKALSLDPKHVKALYRRAVASRAMGDLDEAKVDLRAALAIDSDNASCKRELAAIKKQLEVVTQQQKSALAKAFSSGGKSSFLYTDKEEEERLKQLEKERKQKEKEKRKESRRKEWEDECVRRMTKGEKAISFDEWEKEQEAEEKRRKEEEKKKREAERKQRQATQKDRPQPTSRNSSNDDDDDDDELTEQELASLRGYKKTKDGRTTSYFTRELSEEERQRMGDMAPKKLNTTTASANSNSSPTQSSAAAARASAWNQAGTWEERDCTSWCKDNLHKKLIATETTVVNSGSQEYKVKIVEVQDLTGEGSVAFTGGKKRYIFDFHAKLKYEVHNMDNDENTLVASSTVRLPDICSTHYDDDELEVTFDSWSKAPPKNDSSSVETCMNARTLLATKLRANVQEWVLEFNRQF